MPKTHITTLHLPGKVEWCSLAALGAGRFTIYSGYNVCPYYDSMLFRR